MIDSTNLLSENVRDLCLAPSGLRDGFISGHNCRAIVPASPVWTHLCASESFSAAIPHAWTDHGEVFSRTARGAPMRSWLARSACVRPRAYFRSAILLKCDWSFRRGPSWDMGIPPGYVPGLPRQHHTGFSKHARPRSWCAIYISMYSQASRLPANCLHNQQKKEILAPPSPLL